MTAVRERQRWVAALALAVAVPLPFTGIGSVPFLLPFVTVAAWVVASRRPLAPLPAWLENVLAPLILVAVVAAGGVRYGILRPVAQLAVLVAAVRLPGCGQRSRTTSTAGTLVLVGVAGIASSTHPFLALYLVALLALVLIAVARLTGVSLTEGGRSTGFPPLRLVVGSVVVAVLVAAPIFALLPRLRSPFAGAPFGGRAVGGFREAVMLHGIGDVKESRRLAMKVSFPGVAPGRVSPDWLRLAGATMKHYRAGGWVEGRLKGERLTVRPEQALKLVEGRRPGGWVHAEISLEKESTALFVPLGAVTLTMHTPVAVSRELSGALRIPRGIEPPVPYAVEFDPARIQQPPPDDADVEPPPDSVELRALAEQVTRRSTNELAAALALEQHLQRSYRYSLRTNAPLREDPVHWFLFRSREGHCEFFASSMVLLLRTLGIPARLQAGYAGGERDGEGGFLVRDTQAHAWVVAYVEGAWRQFDPTPSEGRPGISEMTGGRTLVMAWQSLEGVWDRWVLTFSLADQVELVRQALDGMAAGGRLVLRLAPEIGLLAALAFLLLSWRTSRPRRPSVGHRPGPVTRALQRVIDIATRRGMVVLPGMTAREFARAATTIFPGMGAPLGWLVREHERYRYAQGTPVGARALRRAVRSIEASLARPHGASPRKT
jgi:transglutaminase-like putative cysteine protease